jgi:putative flavoprotein involved in K+ transport
MIGPSDPIQPRRFLLDAARKFIVDAATPAEPDPAEAPEPAIGRGPRALDLRAAGIGAVVWATGVGPDLGWLPPSLAARAAQPAGWRPEVAPGLHLLGAPWLRRRGSGLLWCMPGDAESLADLLAARAARAAA